ncbi:unnamed protein product [Lampetra planeri]
MLVALLLRGKGGAASVTPLLVSTNGILCRSPTLLSEMANPSTFRYVESPYKDIDNVLESTTDIEYLPERRRLFPEFSVISPSENTPPEDVDTREHLRVYARIKRVSGNSSEAVEESCVVVEGDGSLLLHVPNKNLSLKQGDRIEQTIQRYSFTHVYGPEVSQKEVFDNTVKPLVKEFLLGNNCLVFTYGVTNSGKTYTVQGTVKDGGLLPRTLDLLFNSLQGHVCSVPEYKPYRSSEVLHLDPRTIVEEQAAQSALLALAKKSLSELEGRKAISDCVSLEPSEKERSYSVWVAFYEIYNELIYDLLDFTPATRLAQRHILHMAEDQHKGPFIKDIKWVQVHNVIEVLTLLNAGRKNQSFASTKLNLNSSRSHSIFTIRLIRLEKGAKPEVTAINEFSICDLAGSERSSRTHNVADRLQEACNINTSLLALGKCITALRFNQQANRLNSRVVPFRESKLTRLFQVYFLGRGKTCMVVNINPSTSWYTENLNVLRFSAIAKQLQSGNKRGGAPGSEPAGCDDVRLSEVLGDAERARADLREALEKASRLRAENSELLARCGQQEEHKQRLESDLAALRETLGERGGEERLSDVEAKTNPAGARASQELHRTKRELLEVMRTLSSKNKELDAAQADLEEVGVLKAQNGQLAAECALQAATLCEQAQALVVLDRRLEGSCAELREKAATLSATEGAVAGLQAELAELRRELREERDRLEVARDAAEREASSRRDLAEVKAELANLLAQLGEARREAAEKIAELEEARVRLAELGQLKTQNEELFNKSMHQADTLKEVTEDCENLRKELEQCLKVLRDERGEADERTEDNDLKAAQAKAGVELEETRSKLTETRQELERATRKYEEAQKELADVRARANSGSGAGNFHRTMAALEERCERMAGQSDESESGVGTPRAEAPVREVKRLRELLAEHETASAEAKARESRLRREARMAQDALKAANRLMGEWEAKLAESKANVATASGQDGADRRCAPERTLAEKEEPESVALAEIAALERGAAEKEAEGQVRAVPAGEEASAPVAGTDGRYRELIGASEATRAADVERLEATVAELTVEKEKLSFDLSALREANGVLCQELQVCEETMRTLESRLGAEETAERRAERARAEKAELEEELARFLVCIFPLDCRLLLPLGSVRAKLRVAAEESDDLREKLSDVRRQMQHVEKELTGLRSIGSLRGFNHRRLQNCQWCQVALQLLCHLATFQSTLTPAQSYTHTLSRTPARPHAFTSAPSRMSAVTPTARVQMEMARAEKERSARLEQELEKVRAQGAQCMAGRDRQLQVLRRVSGYTAGSLSLCVPQQEPVVTPVDSRWKEAQRELTSQLKEAELRRNVEVKRWAAEREKLQKQIQEVESKKEQELRAWREERDLLATGLASEFDSLRTALAERDAEISCLNAVVAANAAAKIDRPTSILTFGGGRLAQRSKVPPLRSWDSSLGFSRPLIKPGLQVGRRRDATQNSCRIESLASNCDNRWSTVVGQRGNTIPNSHVHIFLSQAKVPSRQKASDEGRSGSRLMKLRSKAQLKGSCEQFYPRDSRPIPPNQDGGASGETASAGMRLGAGKGGGDTGATGPMQRIGDFLQSSPTRLKSCAKQIASTFKSAEAVNAAAADAAAKTPPPLGKRKCKRKLLKLEISSPMDFSSHTFVDNKQQNVEKESDHSTIMRQLRRRKQ